jgi:hypothetical protein
MPQDVIDWVHTFARCSKANHDLLFAWRDGTPIEDNDDDASNAEYNPEWDNESTDNGGSEDEASSIGPANNDDKYPPNALDLPIAGVSEDEKARKK